MMFEIAGGIILAVLFLAALPFMVAAASGLAVIAAVVGVIAAVIWVFGTNVANPDFWGFILMLAAFIACAYAHSAYVKWRGVKETPAQRALAAHAAQSVEDEMVVLLARPGPDPAIAKAREAYEASIAKATREYEAWQAAGGHEAQRRLSAEHRQ